jgi:hypothetical protein
MRTVSTARIMPDPDPDYPLCWLPIASHLGIAEFREDNAEENLRRVKRFVEVFSGDHALLCLKDGAAMTPDDITRELIAQHLGQQPGLGSHSAESFDDHMLDVVASITGVPRHSFVHLHRATVLMDRPCDIYQEVRDKDGEELRRVEVYADGRHLWVAGNWEGTGETEKEDTHFPGLAVLNDRRNGLHAELVDGERFEKLWVEATSERCGWIGEADYDADQHYERCSADREENSAFCGGHSEQVQMMFPRMFA